MNISYICKSDRSLERHMLEHLMFYRTPKYEKPASFYKYLNDKGVGLNFYSLYDYTEITFYNVNKDLESEIDEAFKTFFFTEQDFELEKRVILIECDSYDHKKTETEVNILSHKYEKLCDRTTFEKMTYQDMLKIKESFVFEKIVFADNTENTSVKNFEEPEKTGEKNVKDLYSFSFKKNPLVYELSEMLYKCFFVSNFIDKLNLNRVFTLKESTIILQGVIDRGNLYLTLNKIIEDNFEAAYNLFYNENTPNGASYELLGNLNIKNLLKKDEIKSLLENLIKEICK